MICLFFFCVAAYLLLPGGMAEQANLWDTEDARRAQRKEGLNPSLCGCGNCCQNMSKHHPFFGPLEKLQTQERWKAHYKTLRDEKKRKAEEDGMQHCKMLQVKMSRALSSMLRERGLSDETCCDNLWYIYTIYWYIISRLSHYPIGFPQTTDRRSGAPKLKKDRWRRRETERNMRCILYDMKSYENVADMQEPKQT